MSLRITATRPAHTALLAFAALLCACEPSPSPHSAAPDAPAPPAVAAPTNAPAQREFATSGVIREIAPDGRKAVIRHEEIPGFMPKMVMELNVRTNSELTGLSVGDEITFTLVATDETHWIHTLRKIGTAAPAPTNTPPPVAARDLELDPNDLMPDFEFLTETGATVKFSDYRGKALAFTFIFTRCPIPDFCPKMGRQFSRARELLRARPNAPTNWQLLSISFDPEFDQPTVLANYARNYRGADADRWLYASASQAVLAKLAPLLSLTLAREGGSITHNLRTVVLDAQGRVQRVIPGNEWKADELVEEIVQAAAAKAK